MDLLQHLLLQKNNFDLADFLSEEMQILGVDEVERTDRELYTEKFIVILMSL